MNQVLVSQQLLAEVTKALADAGQQDLCGRLDAEVSTGQGKHLTSTAAAELLGVSSVNTVKNWIEGGSFSGAYQTSGGHWRIPLASVLEEKRRLAEVDERNRRRDLSVPTVEDDAPLL